jgi:hypothetical protein
VVVTFLLIALCAKYFFPYGWTWPQALLFGAMLSATDPVAVVAVLHEVCWDGVCRIVAAANSCCGRSLLVGASESATDRDVLMAS